MKINLNLVNHIKTLFLVFVTLFVSAAAISCTSAKEEIVIIDGDTVDPTTDPVPNPSDEPNAFQMITTMSNGFNLGNTFENGNNATTFLSIKPIIDLYHKAGMKHVRLPVTWMDRFTENDRLADENGNINTANSRFKELVKVIDYAISLDMYVVINTHHEHWLKDFYDGSSTYDNKFSTLWTGIATYFKDYPSNLIFEVLNEPEGNFGELGGSWPSPTNSTVLAYTRKINEVGYSAIRATGGLNQTRLIMVSTNGQGNENMIEEVYPSKISLPGNGNDAYLAIQVHSYNPWSFCGETGSNSNFLGTNAIEEAIKKVSAHSKILKVPINYGEFGVGRSTNTTERNTDLVRSYYKTFNKTTLSENMSYSVWDDRGWFGLISNNSGSWVFTNNIVPFMLN